MRFPVWTEIAALAIVVSLTSKVLGQVDASPLASWDRPNTVAKEVADQVAVPGEIVVGLHEHCDRAQLEAALTSRGMTILGEIPRLRALRVGVGASPGIVESCGVVQILPGVDYAEPNGVGRVDALLPIGDSLAPPTDTWFSEQWHLHNGEGGGGVTGADIDALRAWEIESGSPDVVIAVIDSGIDYAHPEFANQVLQGFDFFDEDIDATAIYPHGIYVAGIIGAEANNGFGASGVVQRCKLLPVRVGGLLSTTFNLVQGIDYATSQGVDVINMSLGGHPASPLLKNALKAAWEAGVVVVASAGNLSVGTADSHWPAASPFAMSIGATSASDWKTAFSSTGTTVDFVAPGKNVITVALSHEDASEAFTGTSAAAPVASGIAALLKSFNRHLSHDQVYALLQAGAEDQVGYWLEDTPGWDPNYGHGRLNAYRSLQALCSCEADDVFTVSPSKQILGVEGSWLFRLAVGSSVGSQPYLMLGTLAGPTPSVVLGQTPWPLAFDAYTRMCLFGPSPLVGHVGVLDEDGNAIATLSLPVSSPASLAGATFHHAAAVYDGSLIRPYLSDPLLLSEPVESGIHALPERLFFEDFESGASGWVIDNGLNGQWHVAQSGECGAGTARAAYNAGEPTCTFGSGTAGKLVSPSIQLTGLPPFRLQFSSVADGPFETSGTLLIRVVDETTVATLATQQWKLAEFGDVLPGTASMHEVVLAESSKYPGRFIHLEAEFVGPSAGTGQGWFLDEISVWNSAGE